jgi:hypothetical protein
MVDGSGWMKSGFRLAAPCPVSSSICAYISSLRLADLAGWPERAPTPFLNATKDGKSFRLTNFEILLHDPRISPSAIASLLDVPA